MYIMLVNIHGLVRGSELEFGRDADTGGQTRYIVDLANALSQREDVTRVDLVTRRIKDKSVFECYSESVEQVSDKFRIMRIPCGGGKYLRKELLWPHLDEFTDRLISRIQEQKAIPDLVHGHYADGGYVAREIAAAFEIPFIFSAHSLGRNKLAFLKSQGMNEEDADRKFKIIHRIRQEEKILSSADMVVTSTEYERDELFSLYNNFNFCQFEVIPPGLDLQAFFPYYEYELNSQMITEQNKQAFHRMNQELHRFHFENDKPIILSLCRPDARKNIDLLIETYGRDKSLQAMANLAIFAGIREDISSMEENEKEVLVDMLLLMDKYDLYGKMAIPKNHKPEADVPEVYRLAAMKGGVFVNTSFVETFGLTLIESSASGLPFIAGNNGGPNDIQKNCQSGKLVDLADPQELSAAIRELLTDSRQWEQLSENGVNQSRKIYNWEKHCEQYLQRVKSYTATSKVKSWVSTEEYSRFGTRVNQVESLLISDIDDTLIGGDRASIDELTDFLRQEKGRMVFGVATGRDVDSARAVLKEYNFPDPEVIISSVGSEIYYGGKRDKGWRTHLNYKWKPQRVVEVLSQLDFLEMQKVPAAQRDYKVSYDLADGVDIDFAIPTIHRLLGSNRLMYNLIFSHGKFVDVVPYRASKGRAIRYLSNKWKIELPRIITAGNSGNDRDMLTGRMNSVVVANSEPELKGLKSNATTYFSGESFAGGVLEGIRHFRRERLTGQELFQRSLS